MLLRLLIIEAVPRESNGILLIVLKSFFASSKTVSKRVFAKIVAIQKK